MGTLGQSQMNLFPHIKADKFTVSRPALQEIFKASFPGRRNVPDGNLY